MSDITAQRATGRDYHAANEPQHPEFGPPPRQVCRQKPSAIFMLDQEERRP